MLDPVDPDVRGNKKRVVEDFARFGRRLKGKAVGKAKAEQDDEATIYLLKPSPLIVAGLTLGVAIATATAVAKIRIKTFWAIPFAGKVVAAFPMMAMPLFLFLYEVVEVAHARANTKNRLHWR